MKGAGEIALATFLVAVVAATAAGAPSRGDDLQGGIDAIKNPGAASELSGALEGDRFRVWRNTFGSGEGFVDPQGRIWISNSGRGLDAPTRAQLIGHEFFHVLELETFGPGFAPNEAGANFFAAKIAPDVGRPFLGPPRELFNSIRSGAFDNDPLIRIYRGR
jgi:hypothetical protein